MRQLNFIPKRRFLAKRRRLRLRCWALAGGVYVLALVPDVRSDFACKKETDVLRQLYVFHLGLLAENGQHCLNVRYLDVCDQSHAEP